MARTSNMIFCAGKWFVCSEFASVLTKRSLKYVFKSSKQQPHIELWHSLMLPQLEG